uniref:Uncharacterized protein n=1 Tax=Magallana gigas TaxID=29159 RepID=K1PW33_MAGGI
MGEEEWKAVGRIIVDGYKLMDYFPIKLAEQLFEDALFGESRADLIEEYLHTVSPVEQTVLRNAMGSFNDIDLEELCDIRVPTIALSCQQLETLEELSRKFCRDQSFDVGNQSLKQLSISQVQSLTRSMTKKLATITVKYPHGERSKYVNTEPEKSALKAMMNSKKPEAIMKHYRKNDKYKDAIVNVVKKEIQKEINVLVSRNGNVFQNQSSENLLKFDWTAVSHEFQAKAPYLHNILCGAANLDLRTKKKLPGVITSAAILLYTRSQGLNQLQYILGLIADKCGMTKEGLKILHDLGVVVSPTSIMKKKKQLVKQQEKQIMETVSTYVNHKQEFTRNASGLSPTAGLESDTEVTSLAACGDSETQGLPCHAAVVESEADKTQYHTVRIGRSGCVPDKRKKYTLGYNNSCDDMFPHVLAMSSYTSVSTARKKGFQCGQCGSSPLNVIMDATTLAYRKDLKFWSINLQNATSEKVQVPYTNLDETVDMGDEERSTRSAKYELPIYHKTGKTKYTIGSIYLTALFSGLLLPQQTERPIANHL